MQLSSDPPAPRAPVPPIGVVHLIREVYGPEPLASFIGSYRAHDAGADHELILLCKGFDGERLPPAWTRAADGLLYRGVFLPDRGMDIPAYFRAACLLEHRYLCFVNSWSRIQADGWLGLLHARASLPGVGIVGATGAWWSLHTVTSLRFQQQMAAAGSARRAREVLARLERDFPPFPNPFVRTNAFLVERERFLSLRAGPARGKYDALAFESGRKGMTRQIAGRGLEVLVVGRDGRGYPPLEWPASRTYRSGEQENLLVSDNRTEMYARASRERKQLMRWLIWGDAPAEAPLATPRPPRPLSLSEVPLGQLVVTG